MQCITVVQGKRCRRRAAPGAQMCLYHVAWFKGPDAPDMWKDRVGREARRLVRDTRSIEGLDAEIALLRLIIRDDVANGNNESARRSIGVLARILLGQARSKPVGRHSPSNDPPISIDEVLERIGAEDDDRPWWDSGIMKT